jgi:hypothetical protein
MVEHGCGRLHRVQVSALLILLLISAVASEASARIRATPRSPDARFENSIGVGASYGPFLERDADFWGLAVDYGRILAGKWAAGASLAFDRESDRSVASTKTTDTFSAVGTLSYGLGGFNLTTGLSKGFADTDNPSDVWAWTDGDWGTGLILGYAIRGFPAAHRWVTTLSAGYEYNITADEPDLSFDIGIGYLF